MTLESGGFIMVNNVAVKVSNLSKEFLLGQDKTVSILKDVSLSVNYGEFVSILGARWFFTVNFGIVLGYNVWVSTN